MDWLPNVDGVLFFSREILPLIREAEPDVVFTIVGRSPAPAVRRLAEEHGIEVTGRVDDVRPYLAASAVNVVPLRIGGGTRLKIFEAMAAGRAVVSTSIGAEGLPTENGRHLLLADDPAAFARSVVTLLREPRVRQAMESEARAFVTTRYDWAVAATHLEDGSRRDEDGGVSRGLGYSLSLDDWNETSMNVAVFGLGIRRIGVGRDVCR